MTPEKKENLREYYITPFYLKTMSGRARIWSDDFIKEQITVFKETIPDYPEVFEILENELHRRELNRLSQTIRKSSIEKLNALLIEFNGHPDFKQVIEVELAIRKGAKHLNDPSGET